MLERFVLSGRDSLRVWCAAVVLCVSATSAGAITLDDVQVWVGSGDSRAGLVIDWADGSSPAVYGYRFDGSVTGEAMLSEIASARPELYLKTGAFSLGTFTGRAVFGLGLDRDNDGFGLDDGTVFTSGIAETDTAHADGALALDVDDTYREGWNAAYWGYYTSDGLSAWGFADAGFTDRVLTDGQWDGFSFQPGFAGDAPSVVVPEPGTAVLLVVGGVALMRRRRGDG